MRVLENQDRVNAYQETSPDPPAALSAEFIRAELEKTLRSNTFCNSPRLSRFLRFVVEQTLQGHQDRIKEYVLGIDVFDRGDSYDPRTDPIVRVEAGRLRTRLHKYYESDGARSPMVFELPKGSYIPSFHAREVPKNCDELPPTQLHRSPRFKAGLLAAALLVLGVAAYWIARWSPWKRSLQTPADAALGLSTHQLPNDPSGRVTSIAVLPFDDLSTRKDQAYFCDGMTDTLIDALTKVDGLRVAARTSAFSLRETRLDMGTIGEKLHVGAVLEGSVQKEDRKLRVSVRLVNVSDGLNIWSETYDRRFEDVFAIQDEIALAIVNALRSKFLGSAGAGTPLAKAYTRSPEAYSLYLKGHYHLDRMTRVEIDKSMTYFAKAIEQDQNYGLAYAGMAEAYNALGTSNLLPPHEVMPKAKAAALKALAIDDSLAEAHAAMGLVESAYDWNWQGSEREFKRAIELNPGYVSAYQWYGLTCLASTGRTAEALATIRQALDLDPLSLFASTNLATVLLRLGRYDEAIQIYLETIDLEPEFFWAYRDLGIALNHKHRFKESIDALEKANSISGGDPGVVAALGYSYAMAGDTGSAQKTVERLRELSTRTYVPPYHIAAIYVGLGDTQRALDWLDRAYEDRSSWMNGIKVDPLFARLRTEPRFLVILKKMNLPE